MWIHIQFNKVAKMKKVLFALFLIFITSANLSAEKIIGVTAFKNLGNTPNLAWLEIGIAESISLKLRNVKEYIVIDRTNVDKVMKEIQLGQSGLIDEKTAKKAGKALNADVLVVGNFQSFGNQIRISAKIVEVESHRVLKQVQSTGLLDNIFNLEDDIALKIIDESKIEINKQIKDRINENYTKNLTAYEFFSKGQQFYYQTNYDMAIDMFEKAADIDKQYSLAYAGLGKAYASKYWHLKNYSSETNESLMEKSFKYSTRALEITPNLDEAHLSIAKYYQNVDESQVGGKWKKCEDATKRVLEINPNNGEGYFLLSRIYGYDDLKEEMYLKKSLKFNPFLVDAYNNLGIIYTSQKKYIQAEKAFRKAVELDPEYKTAYMNIGVIYDQQKQYAKAIDMYKTVIDKYPNYPLGLVNLGIGYRRLNKHDEAIKYFKKAVSVKPDYGFAWSEIGYYYLGKGEYREAIDNYQTALKFDPNNKYSLANIGLCYSRIGKYDEAIRYLTTAYNNNKDYAYPAGELANIYHTKLNDTAAALEWYKKALERDPKNSEFRNKVEELSGR